MSDTLGYISHVDLARNELFLLGQARISTDQNQYRPGKEKCRTGGGSYLMYQTAFANEFASSSAESKPSGRVAFVRWPFWAIVLALVILPGCHSLNPLCGSSRPAPVIGSLSASTITFAQVQQGFVLTVSGKNFVSSSVVIINGTTLSTTVQTGQQLQVTISMDLISGPGTASVTISTPSGNSGYLGCSSGGTSSSLSLTIT